MSVIALKQLINIQSSDQMIKPSAVKQRARAPVFMSRTVSAQVSQYHSPPLPVSSGLPARPASLHAALHFAPHRLNYEAVLCFGTVLYVSNLSLYTFRVSGPPRTLAGNKSC